MHVLFTTRGVIPEAVAIHAKNGWQSTGWSMLLGPLSTLGWPQISDPVLKA